ncbi:MAG: hypothetical protein IJV69_05040 [Kiritimatiellae bacterium]|nr:hypothetical protein [Kiritimatiellia bacterium]
MPRKAFSIRQLMTACSAVLERPWVFHCVAALLFTGTLTIAFWDVLPGHIIFLAPDAPLEPLSFSAAWERLTMPAPALLNLFRLLPFELAYECTFWVDMAVLCGAALFLLRGYRLPWGAAWVGGFAAAFTGYFATLFCAGHRGVVDAVAVTCLAFGLTQRALLRGSWIWFVLLGLVLPLGLAAQADIWFIILIGVATYALVLIYQQCLEKGFNATLKHCGPGIFMAGLCFILTGIPALRHTFGAAQETRSAQLEQASASATSSSTEQHAHWRFTTDWSLPPEDCIDLLIPHAQGCTSYGFDPNPYRGRMGSETQVLRQHSIHLGWLTLLLALWALCHKSEKSQTHRFFWGALAVVCLLLAFGKYTPLYRLVWGLPYIDQIRAPVKWLHLTGFAVAVLAGIGVTPLIKHWGNRIALLVCLIIAGQGIHTIRPYVFPITLPTPEQLAVLPPETLVFTTPTYHAFLEYYGLKPTQNPYVARAALLPRPNGRGFTLSLILPEATR